MRYRLERVSVFRGVVLVEGLSAIGDPILVFTGSQSTATQTGRYRDADDGRRFQLCAILETASVAHRSIGLLFPDGTRVEAPGAEGLAGTDVAYKAMLARFHRETERGGRLLEIGSRARSGNVHRHMFSPAVDYLGMDIKAGPNVDVVGDAHDLTSHVGRGFDFAFSNAVFEHLLMPWKVAIEMGHALNIGGVALVMSHACFPLHEEPWDFWRYSTNAWHGLFNAHTGFEMLDAQYAVPCSIVSDFASGPPLQDIELNQTFILSACLVRKVAEPSVAWARSTAEVYDLRYDH